MRISDWSSDVCSSDLTIAARIGGLGAFMAADVGKSGGNGKGSRGMRVSARSCQSIPVLNKIRAEAQRSLRRFFTRSRGAAERLVRPDRPVFRSGDARSAERRVGKECVGPCRSRGSPYL